MPQRIFFTTMHKEPTVKDIVVPNFSLVHVESHDSVAKVLEVLSKAKISSAPVMEGKKMIGIADLLDLVTFTCSKLGAKDIDYYTSKKQAEQFFSTQIKDIPSISEQKVFHKVDEKAPISEVVKRLSQPNIKRVCVTHEGHDGPLVTQSRLIEYLHINKEKLHLRQRLQHKIEDVFKLQGDVETIHMNKFVIEAFNIISEKKVSGIAVVNDSGELIANISIGDIKRINLYPPLQITYDLFSPIHVFCNLDITPDMKKKIKEFNELKTYEPIFVESSHTFEDALKLIVENRIHRIYVVDKTGKPVHVLSLSDILQQLLPAFSV